MTILSYRYGSHYREGFNQEQKFYLRQSALLRQKLVIAHNAFVQSLMRIIFSQNVLAATTHLEFVKNKSLHALNHPSAKAWRALIKASSPLFLSQTKNFYEQVKGIISESDVFWPNRDAVYDDFMRSHRRAMYALDSMVYSSDLLASNSEHSPAGRFVYRFVRPMTVENLLDGKGPVRIDFEDGNRANPLAQITFPIATTSRGRYIECQWPITVHRPLLSGALVKAVSIQGGYWGSQWRLSVTFMLQKQQMLAPEFHPKRALKVGIDMGWRMSEKGLKVATVFRGPGNLQTYFLPIKWVHGAQYVGSLDTALSRDVAAITGNGAPWYRQPIGSTPELVAWQRLNRHKIEERNNKKARLERWRLDLYRAYANEICSAADVIHMEALRLKPMMAIGSKQGPNQKRQQKMAAISLLQLAIEEVAKKHGCQVRYLPAKNSTRLHDCGHLNPVLKGPVVRCGGCLALFDQDENAARFMANG